MPKTQFPHGSFFSACVIVDDAKSLYVARVFDRSRALDREHFFTAGVKGYPLPSQPPFRLLTLD